jgi:predicted 3-demethylubiquinone-9 3-methyltransferase (glyoxalase superfamily)
METTISGNLKIMPFLWFDGQAEEAVNFYTNLFPKSSINKVKHWGENAPFPAHHVQHVGFELCGLNLYAMDAGPMFKFNESMSLFVHCGTQEELDKYFDALTQDGGTAQACGWVKDRFGLSWQLIPMQFIAMMNNPTGGNIGSMMEHFLKMTKIDIAMLETAFGEY